MSEKTDLEQANGSTPFSREVGVKAERKKTALGQPVKGVWFGLGMMGLIGWSVVVPTLLGAALGVWLDQRHPDGHSWTLALMAAGLTIGCLNAWHWVAQQDKEMGEDQHD